MTPTQGQKKSTNRDRSKSNPIVSDLRKVIDEVGEDRVLALLAHHEPERFDRTILVRFSGMSIRLCARCTGIYLGILSTVVLFLFGLRLPQTAEVVVAAFFPLPAMLDWSLDRYGIWKGANSSRLISGLMVGVSYVTLWARLFRDPLDAVVWSTAIFYVALAVLVLATAGTEKGASG
ncbi:MAG TPA: DUF2085 domain-containing protein [Candidatus Methanoperedenaceae archaeon]|nr:DUF2085 domain-containing protein [Candidatus Methanoperedenaceae archaeon]